MNPSKELIEFLKKEEGFRDTAYKPLPTDRWTVGYGFTFVAGREVREGQTIDREYADILLESLLVTIGKKLWLLTPKDVLAAMPQNKIDAVLSLVYNIGVTKFLESDTGKKFMKGKDISAKFPLWNKSGGMVINGLVNRRKREKLIYDQGIYK